MTPEDNTLPEIATPPSVPLEKVKAALASELASKLSPVNEVLERHGLDRDQFSLLAKDDQFKQMYAEAQRLWHSDLNAKERVQAKTAIMVEDSLMAIYGIVHDPAQAAPARLDAFGKLTEIADMKPRKEAQAEVADKFVLTINIGAPDGAETYTVTPEDIETVE